MTIDIEEQKDGYTKVVLFVSNDELRQLGWSSQEVMYCRLTKEHVEWMHTLSHRKGWPGHVIGVPYKDGARWFYIFKEN